MEQILIDLVSSQPVLMAIIVAMGILRAIFKPLMSLAEAYVKATPSKSDDAWLAALKESKIYKAVAWLLDYLASIKLPKKKE